MMVDVKLFALAKQIVGQDTVTVDVQENGTVSDLLSALVAAHPELAALESSLLAAVNNQFANHSTIIRKSDSVACFPPVSGG